MQYTDEQVIDYDCAIEAINHVGAIYSALIWKEEHKTNPDGEAIADWNAKQAALVPVRQNLRIEDDAGVAKVRADYSAIVRAHNAKGPHIEVAA